MIERLAMLYLAVGRVQAAQIVLNKAYEGATAAERKHLTRAQINVWVAAGEYAPAGKALEELIRNMEGMDASRAISIAAAKATARLLFDPADMATGFARMFDVVPSLFGVGGVFGVANAGYSQKNEMAFWLGFRASLALEEGDIPSARRYLQKMVALGIPQPDASLFLKILEQAAAKQPSPK
jgi:tetratricopeptide (TPR) repeat protein